MTERVRRWRAAMARRRTSLEGRVAVGAAWLMAASIGAGLLQLAMGVIAARLLGIARYGALMLVFSTMYTAVMMIGTVFGGIATRDVAAAVAAGSDRAGALIGRGMTIAVVAGLVLAGALAVAARPLSLALDPGSDLEPLVRMGGALVVPGLLVLVNQSLLSGLEEFRVAAATRVGNWVGNVVGVATLCPLAGAVGGMAGLAAAALLTAAWSSWALVRTSRARGLRLAFGLRIPRADLREYLPMTISNAIGFPAVWLTNVLIARGPHGLDAVAIVNSAASWRALLQLLPTVFTNSLLPVISSAEGPGAVASVRKAMHRATTLTAGISAATAAGIALAAPAIMRSYGADFAPHASVLSVLVAASALSGTASIVAPIFVAYRRQWWSTWLNVATLSILLALVSLWRDRGATGFAHAYLAAYALHLAAALALGERVMRERTAPHAAPGGGTG